MWEVVADDLPDAPPRSRATTVDTWQEFDRAGRRRRQHAARAGARPPAGQGGAVPLQLPGVPGVDVRRVQGGARAGQHELPLRRRRARLPVGQRRRRSPSSSTARSLEPSSAIRDAVAEGADVALGRRRQRPLPRLGRRRTRRRRRRSPGGSCRPWGRSGDDLYLLYTGGTTGMPKGVMWRQDDLLSRSTPRSGQPRSTTTGDVPPTCAARAPRPGSPRPPGLPADARHRRLHRADRPCRAAGSIVTLESRNFDVGRAARHRRARARQHDRDRRRRVRQAHARAPSTPNPDRWDLSSLVAIVSSGVMWSDETKQGLLRHHPG